jgi:hypothetical protein
MKTHSTLIGLLILALYAPALGSAPSGPTPPEQVFLAKGETVRAFEGIGLDGIRRRIEFPKGTTTVLLFFSTGCPTCHRMLPEWNRAFSLRAKNIAIVGVVVDRKIPAGFFQEVSILFPVLQPGDEALMRDYKAHKVPITLRVGPGGVVEDIQVGLADPLRVNQLFRP